MDFQKNVNSDSMELDFIIQWVMNDVPSQKLKIVVVMAFFNLFHGCIRLWKGLRMVIIILLNYV